MSSFFLKRRFIINPFACNDRVKAIIVSYKISNTIKEFLKANNINIDVISSAKNPKLVSYVDDHPDLQIHPINDKLFIVDRSLFDYYSQKLAGYKIKLIKTIDTIRSPYPYDSLLNVGRISKNFIHNGIIDSRLNEEFKMRGIELIKVRQGYSKCSTLNITNDALITQDMGIHKKLINDGFKSYLVPSGDIEIEGYNTGFIGGCGGLIDKNTMLFSGSLDSYKHGDLLEEILAQNDIRPIAPRLNFKDIGSIIPIKE